MMYRKSLGMGVLSTLLLVSSLFAQGDCPTCTVDLNNLKAKEVSQKSEPKTHTVPSDGNFYYNVIEEEDATVDGQEDYYRKNRIVEPIERVEDKILNQNLPTSNYFCDNNKKPVHIANTDLYECV